jgi:hypothetical protein
LDIDEQVGDPEEKERRSNPGRQFRFKPGPLRISGTDSDGLKCTQQQGSADRKTLANSVGIPNGFTTNIIQKTSSSKEQCDICYELKHDGQKIEQCEVCENCIYGLLQMRLGYEGVHV